jgi:hypothetical protein
VGRVLEQGSELVMLDRRDFAGVKSGRKADEGDREYECVCTVPDFSTDKNVQREFAGCREAGSEW